ncbi:hypothetical protein Tco_1222751 [Tanacetum coccineum]
MSASRQGMSSEEMDHGVAQRVANAIETIAIYESKIHMAHDSMNPVVREEATATRKRMLDICLTATSASGAGYINHSDFRSMFEREKLSGTNFNDWFRQLKLVLRVEKKMYVIEQSIPPAPTADSAANVLAKWNVVYDAHNEVACLMLGSLTPELHKQFENYSPYEML